MTKKTLSKNAPRRKKASAPAEKPEPGSSPRTPYRDGIFQPDDRDPPYHYLPDSATEEAALRHTLGWLSEVEPHRYPLGDLIVRALTASDPYVDSAAHPEVWGTFAGEANKLIAIELRALAIAASRETPGDGTPHAVFDSDDTSTMLVALSRRMDSIAELESRLRTARWGHPGYGGYDPTETAMVARDHWPSKDGEGASNG